MTTDADVVADSIDGTVFDEVSVELSRTYAEALVGAAEGQGQVEAALEELDAIVAEVLVPYPKFAALLASQLLAQKDKDRILVDTFEGRALPLVLQFLRVLNRHGRLGLLIPVARAARAIWDHRQNRRPVSVRSAVPLDDAQLADLRDRLGRLLSATPILKLTVDPSLIGGLIVQAGDDVYDASVRRRLEQLRQRLTEGKTHEIQSRRDYFSYSE
ncbi:MAG: ATP synthase F1 subunit delta [Isosphaeraceae bacterium]|nr:ATP synthase F1 subunit delta [Isosphaeraceae bacterium]